jgi:hypothetical protein
MQKSMFIQNAMPLDNIPDDLPLFNDSNPIYEPLPVQLNYFEYLAMNVARYMLNLAHYQHWLNIQSNSN